MVLKVLIFNSFYFVIGVVALKVIFNSFFWGGCGALKKLIFNSFYFERCEVDLKGTEF